MQFLHLGKKLSLHSKIKKLTGSFCKDLYPSMILTRCLSCAGET